MAWRRFTSATVLACVLWILCGAYTAQFIHRGWIPHDEGTIGQSAERVLSGELPHRDFDEVYTGGLTYLHAASMRIFGVNLRAPRLVLFGTFMAFLAAVYSIGRRVGSPNAALVAMALATVWSVPNYFVGLPSWYNLFFATFGVLAFLRYLETGHRRWLMTAGACGGLSLLAKISGLFYLAGGVLFLAYLEQTMAATESGLRSGRSRFWLVAAMPAVLTSLLCVSLLKSAVPALVQLVAPALGVCLFVAWREWAGGSGGFWRRASRLASLLWPFAAGASIPLAGFVLLYWQQDAIADLIRGVFVLPQRRLVEASASPPSVAALGLAVPFVLLLLAGRRRSVPRERLIAIVMAGLFAAVLMLAGHPHSYQAAWAVARAMPLIAAVVGIWVISERSSDVAHNISSSAGARVFLVVTMAAMVALVQVPYATPIYFCYAAPLTVLAIVAIVFAHPASPKRIHVSVAAFFFVFAVAFMNRSYGWNLGVQHVPYQPASLLNIARGGLWIPDLDKREYEELVLVLQQQAAGAKIYAGPDCPEVYFLSGFPNPTRAIFDFLAPVREDEAWMTTLLAHSSIRAVVVNTAPLFSPPLGPGVLRLLEQRFPESRRIGRFIVRFK